MNWAAIPATRVADGIERQIVHGEKLMVCRLRLAAPAVDFVKDLGIDLALRWGARLLFRRRRGLFARLPLMCRRVDARRRDVRQAERAARRDRGGGPPPRIKQTYSHWNVLYSRF